MQLNGRVHGRVNGWKVRAAVAGILAVVALTACSGGGSDDASSSATTAPTTAAPVTTIPGGSDTCPGFRGSTTSLVSTGTATPAFLTDATAGAQGCLDVVTFTLRTRGDGTPPGYTVGYRDQAKQPFQDGDPLTDIQVPGAATLAVTIAPAASTDTSVPDAPQATYTGNLSLEYGDHHHLEIVRELPDGKDAAGQETVNWVIGLDSLRPFRVDRSHDPAQPGVTLVSILIG